ncbi:MAG: D-alanyl-D-alanine carboxypeptidase [Clostridia bacterium]|nr:D-alanyl-D-alanine carboxypeptidase [Clostridia bacterium]
MKNYNSDSSNRKVEIRPSFIAILIVTIVLLITLTISLFVVMHLEKSSSFEPIRGGSKQTQSTTEPSVPAGNLNTTPLYPTTETRTSYKVTAASDIVTLTDTDTWKLEAKNAVLVRADKDSLTAIAEKSSEAKMYPASMTKVMTLIVACERVTDLSTKLTVTQDIADYAKDMGGSGMGLKVGDVFTVEELLFLISYKSDTIASIMIANHIAGSEKAFVELMNEKVAHLGLTGTHFANCTGLHDKENYSTCREFASIMIYALDNELAYKCLTQYNGIPMVVGGQQVTAYCGWYSGNGHIGFSDNPRLGNVTVIAGKTGYIDEAGFTFVTAAKDSSGVLYVNVMVGQPAGNGYDGDKFMSDYKYIYKNYAK